MATISELVKNFDLFSPILSGGQVFQHLSGRPVVFQRVGDVTDKDLDVLLIRVDELRKLLTDTATIFVFAGYEYRSDSKLPFLAVYSYVPVQVQGASEVRALGGYNYVYYFSHDSHREYALMHIARLRG
ncbi:MAG: hypothetical protein KatS3mg087_0495 [Patescibacteria group bacterium]|nr:MAG: hypothetical protein KatS3mg087_0495 [Patescibacteria group bacterium]